VTFTDEKDNSVKTVQAPLGESLLEVAHANDIDLEGEFITLPRSMDLHPFTEQNRHAYTIYPSAA